MTKKRIAALIVVGLVFALALGAVSSAQAFPTKTSQCSGCHGTDTAVVVTATQTSNDGTTASYDVSVSDTYGDGVTGWAVFDGAANVANGYGVGTFSVAVGKTYKVFGVAGAGGNGSNSISISPIAPPPPPPPADTTPPTVSLTSPADGATVSGSVAIGANASDASGIALVEFRVDGVLIVSDTSSPYGATWDTTGVAAGSHTIEAKAFDTAGNSAVSSVSVSIAAPPPPPPPPAGQTSVVTVHVQTSTGALSGAKVMLTNTTTGAKYVVVSSVTGDAQFVDLPYGTYRISVSARGYVRGSSSVVADAATEAVDVTLAKRGKTTVAKVQSRAEGDHHHRIETARVSDDD